MSYNVSPFYASYANASSFIYPKDVTAQEASQLAEKADGLIVKLTETLGTELDLKAEVSKLLYADSTLNTLLLSLYGASEEQSNSEIPWLDTSPQAVAGLLVEKYPSVAEQIGTAQTWSEVNLENAHWNITDDAGFATAVGTVMLPFSEFLMTLLCGVNFKILGNIIKIDGNNGYEDALIPAFEALGCTDYLSYTDYVSAAKADRSNLGANIVLPLLGLVDRVCAAPVDTLTGVLPNAAYFISQGGVENCIDELMSPVTSLMDNVLIRLFAGSSISALNSLTDESTLLGNFSENLVPTLNKMLADSGITLPDIDWQELSSCGTLENGKVTADKGMAFICIFRYLWKTIQTNKSALTTMLGSAQTPAVPAEYSDMLIKVLDAQADDVLSLLCRLMFFDGLFEDYPLTYGDKTGFESAFAQGMTRENYTRMLNDIDRVLYMAIAEFAEYDDVARHLRELIFSNKTVWMLSSTVFSYIEQADLSAASDIISLDFSPAYCASLLTQSGYAAAKSALESAESWASLEQSSVSWGFEDGDALGFINAVSASLRSMTPILKLLLVGGSIDILDTFSIHGGYGYNNAVIPLLEALGCSSYAILTNDEYMKAAQENEDNLLFNILLPIASLLDTFCDKPVKTLTGILPNIIYFIQCDGINQCMTNLLKPLTDLLSQVEKVIPIEGLDMSTLSQLDISLDSASVSELMSGLTDGNELPISIDFSAFDINSIGGMGELSQVASKADINSVSAVRSYVAADSEEVLAYILRFVVQTVKSEENSGLLSSLFSADTATESPEATTNEGETVSNEEQTTAAAGMDMTSMFSSSASGMIDELSAMSVDETVCWLYNFFFREHTVPVEPEDNSYIPNIQYVDTGSQTDEFEAKLRSAAIILCISLALAGAAAAITVAAVRKRKSAKKETH